METIVLLWIGFAVFSAVIASNKGRSGFGWFILGIIFGIFALLVVALLPSLKTEAAPVYAAGSTKSCPDCGETILRVARVCKHCGYRFSEVPAVTPEPDIDMSKWSPRDRAEWARTHGGTSVERLPKWRKLPDKS